VAKAKVYSTVYCGFCRQAERLLKQRGADLECIDVTEDHETRTWLVKETGRRTVPQIWIGETYVGGYDDLAALDRKGNLVSMLEA
jgi:glutaredoxin 3